MACATDRCLEFTAQQHDIRRLHRLDKGHMVGEMLFRRRDVAAGHEQDEEIGHRRYVRYGIHVRHCFPPGCDIDKGRSQAESRWSRR
jgi:hypothetical protein